METTIIAVITFIIGNIIGRILKRSKTSKSKSKPKTPKKDRKYYEAPRAYRNIYDRDSLNEYNRAVKNVERLNSTISSMSVDFTLYKSFNDSEKSCDHFRTYVKQWSTAVIKMLEKGEQASKCNIEHDKVAWEILKKSHREDYDSTLRLILQTVKYNVNLQK